jgi:hypothetical protein
MTSNPEECIVVKAAASFDRWQQDCWYPAHQRYEVQVPPDPRYPEIERFAVEACCPNMNLRYPEGTLIICVHLDAVEHCIKVNRDYLIERYLACGGTRKTELSVMTLVADADKKLRFVQQSSDPDYQTSLPVFKTRSGKIKPIALVTGSQQAE